MLAIRFFVTGLLAAASAANASTIFTDDFESDTLALNKTTFTGGWSVTDGTVDLIGSGTGSTDAEGYDFIPANGNYVDLDGSTHDAGVFSKSFSLLRGVTYTASFMLAGSQRNFTEVVAVSFGTTELTYTLGKADPFGTYTLSFTPKRKGEYSLSFANQGGDLEGALLDGVTVSSVPEPSSYALMLGGLAAVGFAANRRRQG